jgi:mono/diheme cytochrome c family protein
MSTEHTEHAPENGNGNGDERGELYGILAEFDTPGELVAAARKVKDAGYTDFDCFSPFPVHGIDPAMGIKRTILPLLIFGGGFAGACGGIALQWYANTTAWSWNISGKPLWPYTIPAGVPIFYECAILLAVLTSFFGMWMMNKLPQVWHPFFRLERFGRVTDDGFFLGIDARDRRFDAVKTRELLEHAGAIAVESAYLDPSPKSTQMPKWITAMIVAMTAFALIPFAIAAKARNSHSSEPHIHIFPDMDFQPKFKSDTAMDMFSDGRANRGEVPHSVPRGWLVEDDVFYRGKEGDKFTVGFPKQYGDGRPFAIDNALLARGQDRFNIYCTPCHGYDGKGMGAVRARVKAEDQDWSAVRNLVEVPDCSDGPDKPCKGGVVVQMTNGQLFNTITNGKDTMMGYAAQIPAADRWAIVAYVRALQRAQNASLDDTRAP